MITLDFLAKVVLVSASGVLGPGPLFLASTLRATRIGVLSGLQSAVGHTIVEAPLVFALAVGLSALLNSTLVNLVGLLGGTVLLAFAFLQFRQAYHTISMDQERLPAAWQEKSGIGLGIIFTGLNPFFILWWLTIGSALISEALLLGAFEGVTLMFASHIWMDYAWLGGTAAVASRGKLVLGKWFRVLLLAFGLAMTYFGIAFILSAI